MLAATRKVRLIMELRMLGITDRRVLSAMEKVPRDRFVPDYVRDQAYENIALPIGHGQTVSQPYVVALMSQALELTPQTKVLEIGTGCGYQTAILAQLARRVYSVERHRELTDMASGNLSLLRLHNVTLKTGDGYEGWPVQAPFGGIIVTCAASEIPEHLVEQLADGGRMVIPLGGSDGQDLIVLHKSAQGLSRANLGGVRFVPFVHGLPNGDGTERGSVDGSRGMP